MSRLMSGMNPCNLSWTTTKHHSIRMQSIYFDLRCCHQVIPPIHQRTSLDYQPSTVILATSLSFHHPAAHHHINHHECHNQHPPSPSKLLSTDRSFFPKFSQKPQPILLQAHPPTQPPRPSTWWTTPLVPWRNSPPWSVCCTCPRCAQRRPHWEPAWGDLFWSMEIDDD